MSAATTALLMGMSRAQLVMQAQDMQLEIEELRTKLAEAEIDAAQYLHAIKHIKHSMTQASILGNDKTREIALSLAMCNAAMKEQP